MRVQSVLAALVQISPYKNVLPYRYRDRPPEERINN
jgi:hypothetical protein